MKIEFVEARLEHVIDLVARLRERERAVCAMMYGSEFEKLVTQEVTSSLLAWAGLVDGRCGAIWGVKTSRLLADEGTLWMIGTTLIDEYPIAFLRHSRRALADLRGTFHKLYGCVLTDYSESQRWLEWLGFEIGPDQGGIRVCEYRFV
jgi:hypothetical protein